MVMDQKRERGLLVSFTFLVLFVSILSFFFQGQGISITGFVIGTDVQKDYNLYILNALEGESMTFVVPVQGPGSAVSSASAEIEIFDSNNQKIASLSSQKVPLSSNESKELKIVWNEPAKVGQYQVRVLIIMDEDSYSYSKNFKVEKKTLSFESIVVNEFVLGEVANFGIVIQNHLSEKVENVSAGILIYDSNTTILAELRSNKSSLESNATGNFKVSWNTAGIKVGKYNSKLVIDYGEEFIDQDIVLNVQEGQLEVYGIGYSISQKESNGNSNIIIYAVVILIIVNLAWWVAFKRKEIKNK